MHQRHVGSCWLNTTDHSVEEHWGISTPLCCMRNRTGWRTGWRGEDTFQWAIWTLAPRGHRAKHAWSVCLSPASTLSIYLSIYQSFFSLCTILSINWSHKASGKQNVSLKLKLFRLERKMASSPQFAPPWTNLRLFTCTCVNPISLSKLQHDSNALFNFQPTVSRGTRSQWKWESGERLCLHLGSIHQIY